MMIALSLFTTLLPAKIFRYNNSRVLFLSFFFVIVVYRCVCDCFFQWVFFFGVVVFCFLRFRKWNKKCNYFSIFFHVTKHGINEFNNYILCTELTVKRFLYLTMVPLGNIISKNICTNIYLTRYD